MELNKHAIAYLNAVFGYSNDIPDAPVTRSHRMDDKPWRTTSSRLPKRRRANGEELTPSMKILLNSFAKRKEHTFKTAAEILGLTEATSSTILAKLHAIGKLERRRESFGNLRTYIYTEAK